jgi:NAD(P)-dependent dehydrogenase (short-subunit alcohol dehydrogenase family)
MRHPFEEANQMAQVNLKHNMSSPIVLVTGANTGLGFEIVKALSQSSAAYTVLIGGRSLDKAQTALKEAELAKASSSTRLNAVQIDIEDDASISSLYDHIEKQYGRLDVLINNAGTSRQLHRPSRLYADDFRRPVRSTSSHWRNRDARHVESDLGRQHHQYMDDHSRLDAASPQVRRPTPNLHD